MTNAVKHLIRALLAVALATLAACGGSASPVELSGYERAPTPNVANLSLPAVEADGGVRDFMFRAEPDQLLLVYFGYTACPDVCPTTLADVGVALDELGDRANGVHLAMVTIDPEVDTPEVLPAYVRSFVDSSTAIRSTEDSSLREVAFAFGADYGKQTIDGIDEVFHTGSLYAVNDAGDLVLTWPFGTTPQDYASDITILQDRS